MPDPDLYEAAPSLVKAPDLKQAWANCMGMQALVALSGSDLDPEKECGVKPEGEIPPMDKALEDAILDLSKAMVIKPLM